MATRCFKTLLLGRALSGSALATAIALGACTFAPSGAPINGDGSPAPLDGSMDGAVTDGTLPPDAALCWTWTPAHFDPCMLPVPDGPLVIAGESHVYSTDSRSFTSSGAPANPQSIVITQADGTEAVIISVTDLRILPVLLITGELRVEGSRPLIIAASGTVEIAGTLDVASRLGEQTGAGANHARCPAAGPGQDDMGGAGGGGGGGFQGKGGKGGPGDSNEGQSTGGDGSAALASVPATVRGGCPGASGGQGNDGSPAPGGDGGGAVQITAQLSISVLAGTILAGGSGGAAGPISRNGGSGGGSGGYIGLDAPEVNVEFTVMTANGGGGGEGGVVNVEADDGSDGGATGSPAPGGSGEGQAGDGGDGGAGTSLDGADTNDLQQDGGGGGGGAVGYIIIRTADLQGSPFVISPPATEVNP